MLMPLEIEHLLIQPRSKIEEQSISDNTYWLALALASASDSVEDIHIDITKAYKKHKIIYHRSNGKKKGKVK